MGGRNRLRAATMTATMTPNIAGEPDTTSGTATREPRPLREPLMRFRLLDEIERLAREPEWNGGDRNSIVLAKDAQFRLLLSVLRRGARIADEQAEATL